MHSSSGANLPFKDQQWLRILQWNAGGFSHVKRTQLMSILISQDIDVFIIVEANLSHDSLKLHTFGPYCTKILPKLRRIASGILVGVRKGLISDFHEISNLSSYNGAEIIKLDVWKRKRHFKVYGCYSPPGNTKLDLSLLTFTSKTILCGDFNAHSKRWNYSDLNSAGKVMEDLLIADQMELLYNDSDIPTYLHYNGNGTNPDLTLASADIADDVEREVICDPGSGHRMIITGIGFDTSNSFKRPFKNRWNFAKADWKNFTLENETIFESVSSFCKAGESVDRVFSRFVKIIFETAKKWIPRGKQFNYKPFWNENLAALKEKSSTARFIAEQSKNPEDVQNWRKSVAHLRKEILTAKRNCFNNFVTKIDYRKDGKSISELREAVGHIRCAKSPGPDNFHPEFLKHLGCNALSVLLTLYNHSWKYGVPAIWKKAIVVSIPKKNKPLDDLNSYRPISLTSILSKVMERMISSRHDWYIETNNLLTSSQAGFKKCQSTNQQVVFLGQSIKDALDQKHSALALFVDFEAAFDKVWRLKCIQKLQTLGVCNNMLMWIRNFISQRFSAVRFGNAISSFKQSETGLPQGTVISPILFNIFINDLPDLLASDGLTNTALFADDLAIWCSTPKRDQSKLNTILNLTLERLHLWCIENNMTVNLKKTTCQFFTLNRQPFSPNWFIKNIQYKVINDVPFELLSFANPLDYATLDIRLDLVLNVRKRDLSPTALHAIALETINTRFPPEEWLHIYTDGSLLDFAQGAGIGVFCHLFSFYLHAGPLTTHFDGEVEAIHIALQQLAVRLPPIERAVILSDSTSALQALSNYNENNCLRVQNCRELLGKIKGKIVFQWVPSHCGLWGNERADFLAKKGTGILQNFRRDLTLHSAKLEIKRIFRESFRLTASRVARDKPWSTLCKKSHGIPSSPRAAAVAKFRLLTGHDCLCAHLFRFNLVTSPICVLCNTGQDMTAAHLDECSALNDLNCIVKRY
ncbi:probable RNA-directed DNA polymerase from transposon BS [Trichonephila clavipes]|nr:probable RNA-directed DNA polymerase from transposon BS [Trichonephila clavipes]